MGPPRAVVGLSERHFLSQGGRWIHSILVTTILVVMQPSLKTLIRNNNYSIVNNAAGNVIIHEPWYFR